ncbi:phosphoribosylanthranilate isomerase [Balnearium lithotrophicum]|uniref:N-(5'-phosphoribosyl)anthranilate isomerase n=1 Tax=Balnearium lithotrophicum TaxID=223788 RepID=A0A521BJ43_9BACT|nr:phosphoribosylanthranilate isomerase [Balnearium lithotrophicum]SMO46901.1 phosphoribosylanthranilate isomerase [Balnearium lithotrophicum]
MVRVKVCGITNLNDALITVKAGADAVGFILYPKSKRFIKAKEVRRITQGLPPFIFKVGVFVNEDLHAILEILSYANLDFAQLHGDESPEECEYIGKERVIKVFRLKSIDEVEKIEPYIGKIRALLLDTYSESSYGGTGKTFNWEIARAVKERFPQIPLILSGGLNPENVRDAIKEVNPYAIDVSSGVERAPGIKDREKVELFIRRAKCE